MSESEIDSFSSQFQTTLPYISVLLQPDPTCSDFKDNLKYCLNIEGITGSCSEIVIDKSFSEMAEGK